ncbi:Cobalt-zinc-cadmium resistance protein CzcC [Myxococcaceae bacterium]|nr:Cobalt-zinc-cadmium resistance protein CzcC [Myxococcaceae bacterium]
MWHGIVIPIAILAVVLSIPESLRGEGFPAPRPLGADLESIVERVPDDGQRPPRFVEPEGAVTLRMALAAAMLGSPDLATHAFEIRAREAHRIQASLRRNPEANLEVEDIGGSGDFAGVEGSQTTLRLSQLVELGGKRDARTALAGAEIDVAGWDYEAERIALLARTAQSFYAVLGAQLEVSLRREEQALAESMLATAERRLRTGIAPSVEVTRARVALEQARLSVEQADLGLDHARHTLSARWGSPLPRFDRAEGDLERLPPLPDREALLLRLEDSPALARFDAEALRRRAALRVEESRAVPDVTFVLGPRWIAALDEATAVGQVLVPLPIFDRNQGRIAEAHHRLSKLASERRAERVRAESEFVDAYETLRAALLRASSLRERVLPEADRAVREARDAWERGLFGFLDVLDAERTRLEQRLVYVEALAQAHREAAELERVVAVPLEGEHP